MSLRPPETGNGDVCPQDSTHGRMWFNTPTRQWCPNARHIGNAFYERNGTMPAAPRSQVQVEAPTPSRRPARPEPASPAPRARVGAG